MRALAVLLVASCLACSGVERSPAERGKLVYQQACISCHNPDPTREGSVGPAVAGSSAELVRARVLYGTYPPGYTPRRDSKLMPPQPYLEPQLPDLIAYLAEAAQQP
jgi:mono/diheme cytochrome c family protein